MSDDGEIIGGLLLVGVVLVVAYFIVIAALYVAGITVAIGTTFGGAVSLYNYGLALKNNINSEKPMT